MRLTDLEPAFIRHEKRDGGEYSIHVMTLSEAQSVEFLCPACFVKNGGAVGTHLVIVTFAGRGAADHQGSQSRGGGPSRWTVTGTTLADLTTQPSVDTTPGCTWHGYITNGEVS